MFDHFSIKINRVYSWQLLLYCICKLMLTSSSRYNQRLAQSIEPRKNVVVSKQCRSLEKIPEIPVELLR